MTCLAPAATTIYIWFCGVRACFRESHPRRLHDVIVASLTRRCLTLISLAAWAVLYGFVFTVEARKFFLDGGCFYKLTWTVIVDGHAYKLWVALAGSLALPWTIKQLYFFSSRLKGREPLVKHLGKQWCAYIYRAHLWKLKLRPGCVFTHWHSLPCLHSCQPLCSYYFLSIRADPWAVLRIGPQYSSCYILGFPSSSGYSLCSGSGISAGAFPAASSS